MGETMQQIENEFKILIVEDDKEINNLIKTMLEKNNYSTEVAFTGLEAMDKIQKIHFDMILLDLMLPYISGDNVLIKLRQNSQTPVIVISAKETTQMKIDILRLGADDYITKPFDIDEILARIESVFRRIGIQEKRNEKRMFKDLEIDFIGKEIRISGKEVELTATEYRLLETLLNNPTKVFSKENLFESVWGEAMPEDDNALNVHMSRLRHKLKQANQNEEYIQTLWGLGYRLSNKNK